MKTVVLGSLIGLVLVMRVEAEPSVEGWVQRASGEPAAGAQVMLFNLTDLRQAVGATTDATGYFTLPLGALQAGAAALPTQFGLGPNYPNPFNPATIIPYQLPIATSVRLDVFNVLGQRIATLVNGPQVAGFHTARWDGTDAAGRAVAAGVYFYRLYGDGVRLTQRMVLVDGQAGVPAGAAAGGRLAASEAPLELETAVYGLVVAGADWVTYVDPAFRVGADLVGRPPFQGARASLVALRRRAR